MKRSLIFAAMALVGCATDLEEFRSWPPGWNIEAFAGDAVEFCECYELRSSGGRMRSDRRRNACSVTRHSGELGLILWDMVAQQDGPLVRVRGRQMDSIWGPGPTRDFIDLANRCRAEIQS